MPTHKIILSVKAPKYLDQSSIRRAITFLIAAGQEAARETLDRCPEFASEAEVNITKLNISIPCQKPKKIK